MLYGAGAHRYQKGWQIPWSFSSGHCVMPVVGSGNKTGPFCGREAMPLASRLSLQPTLNWLEDLGEFVCLYQAEHE